MTRTGSIKGIRVLGAETTITAVGNTTETGTLELHELSTNGQNKVSISAPNSLSADYSLTLPGDDGDADQVLTTDGSGTLTWEDQSGGGGDGDITGVTAGVGLSGGGASGGVTLTVDISEFSDVTPANGDKLLTLDSDGSTEQLSTVAGLATLFAGDGLAASSAVLSLDLKSNGGAVIESNELAIDLAASSITGTLAVGDGGTGQTTLNNLITLGTHTTGNYVETIADSGTGGITVANSGAESAAVTLEMDVHGLTTAAIASGDFIAFSDEGESGDPSRKETIDDIATLFAGDGLAASSAVLSVEASQTTITSIYNAGLKIGRDAHNLIDFATTDDEVIFRIANVDEIKMIANALVPVTSDGAALGTASLMWQDLFLASGAVINFNNGDVTLTHSGNALTVGGGNLAATISTATQGTIDHDSLANFVANKHIDHTSVSVIAGTGLTGGGTIAANRTLNVIGGDGITANANDMAITAAQTTITSIYNAGLKIGRDAHNLIDFATTDDEVIFRIANVDEIKMIANALVPVTSDGAALGTASLMWQDLFLASGAVINFNNGDVTLTHSGNALTVGGGNLAATISTATQGTIDHDSLANFVANEHIDHTSVSVIAGDGLTGGGTIAANRTFAVGAGTGIDVAADAISVDVSDFMANGANNRIVTATGTDAMNAEANLTFDGSALSLTGTLTIGVDDTGHDIKFFGATAGAYMLWDESEDDLIVRKGRILLQNAGGDSKFIANTNGNVTVTDLTVSGGDINYDNGQDATFSIDATTSTTAGRDLTISAGSTATGSADINGGDLHLKSGGGDGTGTSIMTFSTKVSGTDTAAERMRIHTNGSIGIGTNSPSEKLEVYPDTNISAIFGRAHIGHMGFSTWAGFSHVNMNDTGSYGLLQSATGITLLNAADTKYIDFRLNNVSKMKLNADGDLEVGNDIKLNSDASTIKFGGNDEITLTHVHDVGLTLTNTISGTDNRQIVFQLKSEENAIVANDVIGSIEFAAGDSDGTDGATVAAGIHAIAENTFTSSANPTKLVFTTGVSETAAASATAKMTLSSGGNLTTVGNILPSSSDGGTLGSVSLMWSDLFLASGGVIHWHDGTGEVTITHSANTIAITSGYGSEVCALTVEGDITAFSSDKRLKKNIEIIENPLQKIDKLSGFIYDWDLKKCNEVGFNPKDEKQIGVFAQDVKEVIPEAVKPAPFDTKDGISISGDNYLTVQYEKIVPLLIESIKEQQKQIDELRNEIEILKN